MVADPTNAGALQSSRSYVASSAVGGITRGSTSNGRWSPQFFDFQGWVICWDDRYETGLTKSERVSLLATAKKELSPEDRKLVLWSKTEEEDTRPAITSVRIFLTDTGNNWVAIGAFSSIMAGRPLRIKVEQEPDKRGR